MTDTFVFLGDVTLGVEIREVTPATPAETVLVLLHGFTGSAASWGDHLATFAAYGMDVVALDMLGHGESDAPDDSERYSIEHCQQDILDTMEALGIEEGEATLLGYSMGGRIALYTSFSGFFRALILESTSAGLVSEYEQEQRRASDEVLAQRIEREGVAAFVNYWEQLPLFASQQSLPPEVREKLHNQRLSNNATGLANSLRGVGTGAHPALYDKLSSLDIPVLLIAGELDTKFCTIARQMAASLPHVQLAIVPNAGHTVHLEQPEIFDRLVRDFIGAIL